VHSVLEAADTSTADLAAELAERGAEALARRHGSTYDASQLATALLPSLETPLGPLADGLRLFLAAMMLQLAVSRQREYLADATAASYLGEGRPLSEALATLERGVQAVPMNARSAINPAMAVSPKPGQKRDRRALR